MDFVFKQNLVAAVQQAGGQSAEAVEAGTHAIADAIVTAARIMADANMECFRLLAEFENSFGSLMASQGRVSQTRR